MDTSLLITAAAVVVVLLIAGFLVWRRSGNDTVPGVEPAPASLLGAAVRRALGGGMDDATWDEIEDALLGADVGVAATEEIVSELRRARPGSPDEARRVLARALDAQFAGRDRELSLAGSPAVVLVVGVNGTGKTTTVAKLARRLQGDGRTVLLAAADTFRAAAAEQLLTWGERLEVQVVRGQEGADPAAVVHDALQAARARGADVVLVDTAGRLHAKSNLMSELQKIHRVAGGAAVDEVLLVLDATSGQNGLTQVAEFSGSVPVTGIVLTKLDGTARGGIVVAVERRLGVPVKYVGVGEGLDDLRPFHPESFVNALLE